jgi:hypothetical protein
MPLQPDIISVSGFSFILSSPHYYARKSKNVRPILLFNGRLLYFRIEKSLNYGKPNMTI